LTFGGTGTKIIGILAYKKTTEVGCKPGRRGRYKTLLPNGIAYEQVHPFGAGVV